MASPMDVAIAGGHGKIGRRLAQLLVAHGDRPRALIRKPEQSDDVRADGSEAVVCDLEHAGVDEISRAITGADAVVFAAGAGPGSGPERKWSMDRDGAIKLLQAAQAAGVERYVMISAVGAEDPPDGDDVFNIYLRAKAQADQALQESDRAWTIVRPGMLRDDAGRGLVRISTAPFQSEVSRDDVAAVLLAVLLEPSSVGRILYVGGGDHPIERALAAALD